MNFKFQFIKTFYNLISSKMIASDSHHFLGYLKYYETQREKLFLKAGRWRIYKVYIDSNLEEYIV